VARDLLIVVGGAALSACTGLLVGRLWVLRRRRTIERPAADRRADLAETLKREAAASIQARDDVEATLESEH
jgi:hypothetical protein